MMRTYHTLLVIDVQNDFCPGGALPVPDGDEVIPVLNEYVRHFGELGHQLYFSRDWHPPRTTHFREWGGAWPPHCVQETPGAEFHPSLAVPSAATIVSKGMDPAQDSYSAFQGIDGEGRPLTDSLRARGVRSVYVGGLATDYCVKCSVTDALRNGFEAVLLADAVRGIDVTPGDVARALEEMRDQGARIATIEEVVAELRP